MTTKKERLVRNIAGLVAEHSESDWQYVADQFEEISKLARSFAEEAQNQKLSKSRRKPVKRKTKSNVKQLELTSTTQTFAEYLDQRPSKPTNADLRNIAISIGMKSELPKTKSAMILSIYRYLDDLDEDVRVERIRTAIMALENKPADQSDEYNRWVSLITKRPIR
ncbi:MAG: hypothetical protein ACTS1X_09260 [Parasphingopyxis sp.]|uniref:hypothetical protein n=1 Tax=Parasphingopyxis sp. TaxID=1920299 RepID=UPI003FA0DA67